jgi:hypothetical protein
MIGPKVAWFARTASFLVISLLWWAHMAPGCSDSRCLSVGPECRRCGQEPIGVCSSSPVSGESRILVVR